MTRQPEFTVSNTIVTLRNALIAPPEGGLQQFPRCGVLSNAGDVPLAALVRPHTRLTLPVSTRPAPVSHLMGRHLWGGQIIPQFGHFVSESISRLWAFKGSSVESILFIGKSGGRQRFAQYQLDLFRILGIDVPVTIVTEPTEVEELVVPGQGFGLAEMGSGTDEFLAMMRDMAETIEPAGPERIYISRTLTGPRPRVLGEPLIESNLAAQGYTVYHPQHATIAEQLAQYRAATHVIGLDGSAFHLFGFVARPDARAAIIMRRNARAYFTMQNHLTRVMDRAPDVINVLVADWVLPEAGKPNQLSWGEIDHARLGAELKARGYIDPAADWQVPAADEIAESVREANGLLNTELVRLEAPVRKPALAGA